MSLAGFQINPIDVNFQLQNSLEIFDRNSADKILSKKEKEIKVSPTVPNRVKMNWKHNLNSQPCNISWPRRSTLFPQSIIGMRFSETSCKINNHSIYSRTVRSQLLFSTFWYIRFIPGWSGRKSSLRCMMFWPNSP